MFRIAAVKQLIASSPMWASDLSRAVFAEILDDVADKLDIIDIPDEYHQTVVDLIDNAAK